MTNKEKQTALKELNKAEEQFYKAELRVSALANFIQPYFDKEIFVCMSTDGAVITDIDGEIGFLINYLKQ